MSRSIEKICLGCKKMYIGLAKEKKRKYCCRECYLIARPSRKLPRIEKSCERCGTLFLTTETRGQKFCSSKCAPPPRPASEKPGVMNNCLGCGKEFYIRHSHRHQKFCSKECRWSISRSKQEGYGIITARLLKEYLMCDFETGALWWRKSPMSKIAAGEKAGTLGIDGYIQVVLNGVSILGHRIVWALFHGEWPKEGLDHRDGDRANNAISNLREATSLQNALNKSLYRNNKSGTAGVNWSEREQRWKVGIGANKKYIHLGTFENKKDAVKVRKEAEVQYFGEFRRGT